MYGVCICTLRDSVYNSKPSRHLYVCIYIYVCICMYIYIYTHTHKHMEYAYESSETASTIRNHPATCIGVYACMYVCAHVHSSIRVHAFTRIYRPTQSHACKHYSHIPLYVCMHVNRASHTHTSSCVGGRILTSPAIMSVVARARSSAIERKKPSLCVVCIIKLLQVLVDLVQCIWMCTHKKYLRVCICIHIHTHIYVHIWTDHKDMQTRIHCRS
jgi:hypothetical protein